MDALLKSLQEVAVVLMPTLGAICLVLVIMILYRIYKVVKDLPKTIEGVDRVLASTQKSVESLEEPLNAFKNVAHTVDRVNNSAVGFASKAAQFGIKNADVISSFFTRGASANFAAKDVAKDVSTNATKSATNVNEEVFGTYE